MTDLECIGTECDCIEAISILSATLGSNNDNRNPLSNNGDETGSDVWQRLISSVSQQLAAISRVKRNFENRMFDCGGLLRHSFVCRNSLRCEQVNNMPQTTVDRF